MNTTRTDISSLMANITRGITSDSEHAGVLYDLHAISQKLFKKEYEKGFISTNIFNAEQRTKHAFAELQLLSDIAESWRAVLDHIGIHAYDHILDLAPGYTPKVELALVKLTYTKKVTILDTSTHATTQLRKVLSLFSPAFALNSTSANIFNTRTYTAPCVVGNHIVDDLIISYVAKKLDIPIDSYYSDEGTAKKLWKHIKEHSQVFDGIAGALATALARVVASNGILVMTNYVSYTERLLDLTDMTDVVAIIFKQLITLLKHDHAFQQEHIRIPDFPKNSYISVSQFTILRNA